MTLPKVLMGRELSKKLWSDTSYYDKDFERDIDFEEDNVQCEQPHENKQLKKLFWKTWFWGCWIFKLNIKHHINYLNFAKRK